ncbi:hypothetical protein CRG98_005388 [Punica granatum]|uniref:Uncharacterized protein n=1 Tax=Punica granatum TaxID=22663 RepID=A0A2I0L0Q0_PUNGR|nr:hypothetical protein CRG98_005388 [Punica granatum]
MARTIIKVLYFKEGERLDEPESITQEAVGIHKKLLGTPYPNVTGRDLQQLGQILSYSVLEQPKVSLIREVTAEEIKSTIWAMESDKAPDPDGFSSHFLKTIWHIIGEDFTKAVMNFISSSKLLSGVNSTRDTHTLVPKTDLKYSSQASSLSINVPLWKGEILWIIVSLLLS